MRFANIKTNKILGIDINEYVALKAYDEIHALDTAEKKGIKKGKELGKNEAKIEIAKNLLDVLDNETISLKTGLDIETIKNLRNNK